MECQSILTKDICLNYIEAIDNSITLSIEISECQQGYKIVDGICTKYIITPIGNLTEGEIIFIGVGVPVTITLVDWIRPKK